MNSVRPSAVAGTFYPSTAADLSHAVSVLLADARAHAEPATPAPKALIVPHAGYIYSGSTAALAYAQLAPIRTVVRRVILLGPAHRVAVRGLALAGAERFATPLGTIAVDQEAVAAIRDLPQVGVSPAAHALEHSLEVQLPFLQAVLDDFKLVPLVVGDATPAEVAEVLERLWGGPQTLLVISSDLSHFLPYHAAQTMDRETAQHILAGEATITHAQACGGTPVNGLLLAARRHHLQAEVLGLCNSGDTAGDRGRVVGYGAFAFRERQVPHAR
jgi:MEMO1 family protein